MKKLATYDTIKKIVKYMKSNFIRTSDPIFRQPSTAYSVGDVVYVKGAGVKYYLLCVTAGTTGDGDIALPSPIAEKDTVTDGTVIWTIHKIGGGDGVPLGAILPLAHNSAVPAGYLLCDGAAVSRTMYPDLFSVIGTTYGAGDGSTTFNVPDYNTAKRFVQGDTVAGTVKSAGLPNITGSFQGRVNEGNWLNMNNFSGAMYGDGYATNGPRVIYNGTFQGYQYARIDASRSNAIYGASETVQPNALTCRYIIKYK